MDIECFISEEKLNGRRSSMEFMGDLDSGMKSIHKAGSSVNDGYRVSSS
jgi:hypothetical protein